MRQFGRDLDGFGSMHNFTSLGPELGTQVRGSVQRKLLVPGCADVKSRRESTDTFHASDTVPCVLQAHASVSQTRNARTVA